VHEVRAVGCMRRSKPKSINLTGLFIAMKMAESLGLGAVERCPECGQPLPTCPECGQTIKKVGA